jgi:DNA-binding beta-propeller fold protein YncE
MNPVLVAFTTLALLSGRPHVPSKHAAAAIAGDAYIAVYLSPLPVRARALGYAVEAVSALREDGSAETLNLALPDWAGDATARQRLLAWGTVPRGAFTGIGVRFRSAISRDERGARNVDLRATPSVVRVPFAAGAGQAALVLLSYDEAASTTSEGALAPAFSGAIPSRAAAGLIGAVSSGSTGVVTLFDKTSGQVILAVAAGRGAGAMALDAPRNRLYVALSGDDAVATIDLLAGRLIATTALRPGDEPASVALTPDERTLLVANPGSSTVTLFDVSGPTLVERNRVNVQSGPSFVLVEPSGTRAFVFCTLEDTVTVLSLPGGLVAGGISSPGGPLRGELNRAATRLYVTHQTSPYLDAVDTASLAVTQRAYVGPGVAALKVDPQTDRIYLGFRDSDRVEIYDPGALLPIDAIRTDSGVGYLTIDGEGNNLCVLLPARNEVRLLRLSGKAAVARLDIPEPSEAVLAGGR